MTDRAHRLAAITARDEAAASGPWSSPKPGVLADADGNLLAIFGGCPQDEADVEFLIGAREDIPWLLAEVRRLSGEANQLSAENALLERALGLNEEAIS